MKKIEQILLQKFEKAPTLWLFYLIGASGLLCYVGLGIKTFAATINLAIFGVVIIALSAMAMYATLRFYIKHEIIK